MGIFSTIGSFWGPTGMAIGQVADGVGAYIGQRNQTREQNKLEMDKFARLRKAADKGGFHPLEVLRAGGSVNTQAGPRLLTSLSATNAFDALEDEITGEAARERHRQEVKDEILERELEIQRTVAKGYRTTPSIAPTGRTWQADAPPSSATPEVTPPKGATTFGSPVQKPDVMEGMNTVTQTGDIGGDVFEDPSKQDMSVYEERDGDAELLNTIRAITSNINRWDYNAALEFVASRTDLTKQEVHDLVVRGNPSEMRDALPGLTARSVMRVQELWNALREMGRYDEPKKARPPRVIPNFDLVSP